MNRKILKIILNNINLLLYLIKYLKKIQIMILGRICGKINTKKNKLFLHKNKQKIIKFQLKIKNKRMMNIGMIFGIKMKILIQVQWLKKKNNMIMIHIIIIIMNFKIILNKLQKNRLQQRIIIIMKILKIMNIMIKIMKI